VAMDCAIQDLPDHRRLILSGRFSYADSPRFGDILRGWDFAAAPTAVIDADGLAMIDSVAIGMLFVLAQQCRSHGGSLRITGARVNVAHTLKRAGLAALIDASEPSGQT
jgi:anti-anti-sigma factor